MDQEKLDTVYLPLLITRGLVVFPTMSFSLDVGRDFSQNAITYANDMPGKQIICVAQKDVQLESPTKDDVYMIGSLCEVTSILPRNGGLKVNLKATNRVRIQYVTEPSFEADGRAQKGSSFGAEVEILHDNLSENSEANEKLSEKIIKTLVEYKEKAILQTPMLPKYDLSKNPGELSDIVLSTLEKEPLSRQQYLEILDVNKRLKETIAVLALYKQNTEIDRQIADEVRKSSEKNQRDYFLREKLKAIKKELGEDTDDDKSEDGINKKLDENPYPDYIKTKVRSELKRYNLMPQASLESSLIKQYIDILMEIPWYQLSEDDDDLKKAKQVLDDDHYGLEKQKKRIIEYLAVKKMTSSLKAPILCFYGPPGVGKTSLAKSVATALNRQFYKASLGGISDESEIRGHRRTYVGSMPGRVINGLRKCGTRNPVFLLDEVDKLGQSHQGNPAAALLEVLDPSQNTSFQDNYVEEPYDLSDVLFICTANYIEDVPAPLRDRLEMIEVNSYTMLEKIEIALRHLVPKEMLINGLEPKHIIFSREAISYIIEHYTIEAGVRELQRKIGAVCRQVVVKILEDGKVKLPIQINAERIKEYLGVELLMEEESNKTDQIGVVTGLAYTSFGGAILPIEVNYFEGKTGRLVLTGKLGEVMRESATIALDYVRANATKYKIEPKFFEEHEIHIHVPEGAVPKDGPSAGVALTTAIISSLTGTPVRYDVAMTGEVTLRGNALPIGGLREKSLAAMRNGIKTIIIPEGNRRNADELPEEAKDALEIVFMKTVDDALKHAFAKTTKSKKDN